MRPTTKFVLSVRMRPFLLRARLQLLPWTKLVCDNLSPATLVLSLLSLLPLPPFAVVALLPSAVLFAAKAPVLTAFVPIFLLVLKPQPFQSFVWLGITDLPPNQKDARTEGTLHL